MKKHVFFSFLVVLLILILSLDSYAQIFEKSEYAMRRQKLMEKIPDGIVIIRGAQLDGSYMEYYQNNDFIYFSFFLICI